MSDRSESRNETPARENTVLVVSWRTYQLQLVEHDGYWDGSVMNGRFNPCGSFICGRDADGTLWVKEGIGKFPTVEELSVIGVV